MAETAVLIDEFSEIRLDHLLLRKRPMVLHCVYHIRHQPVYLPDDDERPRRVFIARDVDRADIETAFSDLCLGVTFN